MVPLTGIEIVGNSERRLNYFSGKSWVAARNEGGIRHAQGEYVTFRWEWPMVAKLEKRQSSLEKIPLVGSWRCCLSMTLGNGIYQMPRSSKSPHHTYFAAIQLVAKLNLSGRRETLEAIKFHYGRELCFWWWWATSSVEGGWIGSRIAIQTDSK